jgi:hypothetical protein
MTKELKVAQITQSSWQNDNKIWASCIYAVGTDGAVYRMNQAGWKKVSMNIVSSPRNEYQTDDEVPF